ncbi:MAG: CpaF family protein, partial [Terriglobales bacterium]
MATLESIGFTAIQSSYHRKVIERLNLEQLDRMPLDAAREQVLGIARTLLAEETLPLSLAERDLLLHGLLDEIFGYGPLEPLLRDPTISDILVNRADQIYVERRGRLSKTDSS